MRLVVCLGLSSLAGAQQTTQGTLSGNLSGLTGSHNAVVILTNVNSGASQRIPINSDGSFTVSVPTGTYRVEVERDGFRQTARQNLEITSGTSSQLNVSIEG